MTGQIYRTVLSERALADLAELIAYIRADSPENAVRVVEALRKALERLSRYPRSGALEKEAAPRPPLEARRVSVSGFVVRYVFPYQLSGNAEVVFVISIRRAGRLPTDDLDLFTRYLQEAAGTYERARQPALA